MPASIHIPLNRAELERQYHHLQKEMEAMQKALADKERLLREMELGKKAYLFCQNADSCNNAAIMYSLIGACKVLGKDPERWLTYTLKHIGQTKKEDLHKLLPEEWVEC